MFRLDRVKKFFAWLNKAGKELELFISELSTYKAHLKMARSIFKFPVIIIIFSTFPTFSGVTVHVYEQTLIYICKWKRCVGNNEERWNFVGVYNLSEMSGTTLQSKKVFFFLFLFFKLKVEKPRCESSDFSWNKF